MIKTHLAVNWQRRTQARHSLTSSYHGAPRPHQDFLLYSAMPPPMITKTLTCELHRQRLVAHVKIKHTDPDNMVVTCRWHWKHLAQARISERLDPVTVAPSHHIQPCQLQRLTYSAPRPLRAFSPYAAMSTAMMTQTLTCVWHWHWQCSNHRAS